MARIKGEQSKNEPWPRFFTDQLPSDVLLYHKPRLGCVDMTLQHLSREQAYERVGGDISPPFSVVKTGGSTAIRLKVPSIDHLKPFEEQYLAVTEALVAVKRLFAFYQQSQSGVAARALSTTMSAFIEDLLAEPRAGTHADRLSRVAEAFVDERSAGELTAMLHSLSRVGVFAQHLHEDMSQDNIEREDALRLIQALAKLGAISFDGWMAMEN